MIKKILFKYTVILFINLFAFLGVGYILDSIFDTNGKIIALFLILSIVTLVIFTQSLVKKNLAKLENIKNNIK